MRYECIDALVDDDEVGASDVGCGNGHKGYGMDDIRDGGSSDGGGNGYS